MKTCQQCGRVADDNERFCVSCGAVLPDTTGYPNAANDTNPASPYSYSQPEQYSAQPNAYGPQQAGGFYGDFAPKAATKQEFLNLPEYKRLRSMCNTAGIICYVAGGLTFILSVLIGGSWFSLLDVGILIGLGLGIHLKQNKPCAIILLVYSIINIIYMLIAMGTFGGWLILIAGIFAVSSTFSVDKQWKLYQQQASAQQMPFGQPYQQTPYQQTPYQQTPYQQTPYQQPDQMQSDQQQPPYQP